MYALARISWHCGSWQNTLYDVYYNIMILKYYNIRCIIIRRDHIRCNSLLTRLRFGTDKKAIFAKQNFILSLKYDLFALSVLIKIIQREGY